MDAKQLGALDDSLAPRPPSTPSNDKGPVNTRRTISDEHRDRIVAGWRRRFRPRYTGAPGAPGGVDPDFDELEG